MTASLDQFSREVTAIMPFMVREFARREDNDLTRGKISCAQMVALDHVARRQAVKMTDLAHVMGIKTSSASALVDRLVKQKMLTRIRDKADRRVVWIGPTARGRKVVTQIKAQKRRSIKAVFVHLSEKERDQYLSILNKIKSRLIQESGHV